MAKKVTPHYTLVATSADGTCCPCSALSDPCTCAGLIPIVRCRTRGALAEMIGYHAFTDPADPPDTYLQLTGSGTKGRCNTPLADPGGGSDSSTFSGANTYDPVTGAKTVASSRTVRQTMNSCPAGTVLYVLSMPESMTASSDCHQTTTVTREECTSVGSGAACPKAEDAGYTSVTSGTLSLRLTKKCTEQQALYRATNGLKWSDWAVLTELPGCSALWELRSGTTDYDFAVREAEYQLEFPALTITEQATDPSTGELLWSAPNVPLMTTRTLTAQVEVRVDINRRPWNGGSPWMLYRTDTFGPLTITGAQTLEGVVPNDRGYETIVTNVRYRVVG